MAIVEELYLPEDCWECIFKICFKECGDYNSYLQPLSVLSKQFLSVTNRFRLSVIISNETIPFLPRLFQRFPNLTSLNLARFQGDLDRLLCQISCFPLELTPNNFFITHNGIAFAIRERPRLSSLSITNTLKIQNRVTNFTPHFIYSLVRLKGLTCLELSYLLIKGDLLDSIAMKGLPLKRLVLDHCTGYSSDGIHRLLSKCQFIQHLDLQKAKFQDNFVYHTLSLFLGNLVSINLSHCENLSEITLFTLVGKCPLLNEIYMENTGIGQMVLDLQKYSSLMDFVVNPRMKMKSLHLASNRFLFDNIIKLFASICPNLELVDLSNCVSISKGIVQVLRKCKIMHLNLSSCPNVNLHGMNFKVPQLEVLKLSMTKIDDKTLYVISKSCFGLLQLDLEKCYSISEEGVKQVVKNCTRLKEINLRHCGKVSVNVGLWMGMVLSSPSLRKIMESWMHSFLVF